MLGEGCDFSHRRFQLVDDVLMFEPSEWNDGGWSVFATDTNQGKAIISQVTSYGQLEKHSNTFSGIIT